MAWHKFKIGQRVSYRPSRSNFPVVCIVTALIRIAPAEAVLSGSARWSRI